MAQCKDLAGICTPKNLRKNYTWATAINGKNENCRNWPNVCTEFVLTLRRDTLEFLSSLHKKSQNFTARNSDKPVLKLARNEGIKRDIACWLPWKRGLPAETVFLAKHKELTYSKLCLNPDIFIGLKEPDNQEIYISLPEKTEEMV